MHRLTEPPAKLGAGGLLAIVGGLGIVTATGSPVGTTLVVGGLLVLISAGGVVAHDPEIR